MTTADSRPRICTTEPGLRAALVVVLALAGCSTITPPPDGAATYRNTEEFRRYVEEVFRKQNRLGDALIELETANAAPDEAHMVAISLAEERMHDACRSLNDAAIAVAEGRSVGLALSMQIANSIAGCDEATQRLELDLHRMFGKPFASTTPTF